MSYTTDSDAYDQNVSPYLRRRLRSYEEALRERQAARRAARTTDETMAVSRLATGPASRPAPHDVQSAVAVLLRRTLAGPLAMSDCTPPAAATAQEQRQPATLGDRS